MHIRSLFAMLFITGFVAACSQATKQEGMYTFEELDHNANGYISMSEAGTMPSISKQFKSIDTDADGNINITEFQAYMGRNRMTPPEEMEVPEPGAAPY